MKLKNSDNNTYVFNRPCVGMQSALTDFLLPQKKMAELKPPSLYFNNTFFLFLKYEMSYTSQGRREKQAPNL